jgi:hypothetical protein
MVVPHLSFFWRSRKRSGTSETTVSGPDYPRDRMLWGQDRH